MAGLVNAPAADFVITSHTFLAPAPPDKHRLLYAAVFSKIVYLHINLALQNYLQCGQCVDEMTWGAGWGIVEFIEDIMRGGEKLI